MELIFFLAEKRSLTLSLENDEYEVREAAGTMDPLTPNRVTFLGLAGVACNGTEDEIESPNILVVSREEPSNHICHFLFEK